MDEYVYMVIHSTDSFFCGEITKGKILTVKDDTLYYNDRAACEIGSSNERNRCMKIKIKS